MSMFDLPVELSKRIDWINHLVADHGMVRSKIEQDTKRELITLHEEDHKLVINGTDKDHGHHYAENALKDYP